MFLQIHVFSNACLYVCLHGEYQCCQSTFSLLVVLVHFCVPITVVRMLSQVVIVLYPNYGKIQSVIHVRVQDLPISDPLRELRYVLCTRSLLTICCCVHVSVCLFLISSVYAMCESLITVCVWVFDSLHHCHCRQTHLNALIKTSGVVTRRTTVMPQLSLVKYNCIKCGSISGPYMQNGDKELTPGACPDCQSKGPFSVNHEQVLRAMHLKGFM